MTVTSVEISQLWRHVNRQMRELIRSTVKEPHLPVLSFLLLRHIQDEPGITLSELARRVGTAKSHTSTMVEQLLQEGHIEKRSDPSDQRVLKLYLTEGATRCLEGMGDRAQEAWRIVIQELPEGEFEEVERFLRTLLSALERANARIEKADAEPRSASESEGVKER